MSMRVTESQNYEEKRNSIAYEYISFFEALGYIIILIPNTSEYIKEYFNQHIDLVVLIGGNNVNPVLYKNNDILDDVYKKRDTTEKIILDIAIEKSIKILGICRGFHFINIYLGGSLSHGIQNHVNKKHMLESTNYIINLQETNSFHNQAILKENLSSSLEILATNKNIIEAFTNKDKTILGIQWHPERQDKEFDKELIRKFTEGKL